MIWGKVPEVPEQRLSTVRGNFPKNAYTVDMGQSGTSGTFLTGAAKLWPDGPVGPAWDAAEMTVMSKGDGSDGMKVIDRKGKFPEKCLYGRYGAIRHFRHFSNGVPQTLAEAALGTVMGDLCIRLQFGNLNNGNLRANQRPLARAGNHQHRSKTLGVGMRHQAQNFAEGERYKVMNLDFCHLHLVDFCCGCTVSTSKRADRHRVTRGSGLIDRVRPIFFPELTVEP